MKRVLSVAVSYLTTGVGCYYIFTGTVNIYSLIILVAGILGVLIDVFGNKLRTS